MIPGVLMRPIAGTVLYATPYENGNLGVLKWTDIILIVGQGSELGSLSMVQVWTDRLGMGWLHRYRLEPLGAVHA